MKRLISESKNGSSYTIIFIGNDTQILCEGLENKKKAIEILSELKATNIASDTVDAISYAQAYFNDNASIKTYLISDKAYTTKNVELVNVASTDVNYSILNVIISFMLQLIMKMVQSIHLQSFKLQVKLWPITIIRI